MHSACFGPLVNYSSWANQCSRRASAPGELLFVCEFQFASPSATGELKILAEFICKLFTSSWQTPLIYRRIRANKYGLTLINFPRSPTNFRQSSVENFLTNVNKLAAKTGEFARVCQRSPLKCPKYCIMCQQRSKKEVYHVKWHQSLLSRFSMMLYSKHLQLFACANIYADWRPCDK